VVVVVEVEIVELWSWRWVGWGRRDKNRCCSRDEFGVS